ncbi:iron ABC transporter permease [Zhengella mangrovi]|uniref:Iron ABC transporter permease n=1 Tax=Zhengella mangrovi TaxID=1982044 RepID=A0A2G1QLD1_9HYPH|nr:iron ABC transporter permease [Zhengella mangrovi]PHP66260.1 iron ABC transporter permease [Zhengella mangrovi]
MQASQAVNPAPPSPRRTATVRGLRHPLIRALALVIALLVLLPVTVLVGVGLTGSGEDWPHLVENVLPRSTLTTLWLLALVSAGTASIGVTSAWLIVAYDFPLRRLLAWALILPVAVPPYLAAYAFGEFFHFTGPVQAALRGLFGWQSARDYWFPDIRSTEGAAVVLTAVLYPYVYMTTRVVFLMQGRNIADVARTLGARPGTVFRRVLLPVARPAIVAGVALVLMETLNDIGAVEYLGVRTLTFSVYSTWLNRGSLEGAAQIAAVMMVIVFAILMAEQWARRKQGFHAARATHLKARPPRARLTGWKGVSALVAILLPILAGFGIPVQVLGRFAMRRLDQLSDPALGDAFLNSVLVAGGTALLTVAVALLLLNAVRLVRRPSVLALARVSTIGYALPGTILGLGLLFALARFDNSVDAMMRSWFGWSTGLLISGSAGAVVYACTIRFLALAEGTIRSGLEKLPRNVDDAARSLGCTPARSARTILLPLLTPAILTAAVLVFVDTVKELSATILLRPFGFSTLATHVYENASRGVVEDGAVAALLIIATAMAPVMLLSRALMRDETA